MNDDLRSMYHLVLVNDWRPEVQKIVNGMYHIYFWRGENAGWDGVPCVLKPDDISFKTCECCSWKPDDEYQQYIREYVNV